MNRRSPRQARFAGRRQPAAAVIAVLLLIGLLATSPALAARSNSWAKLRQAQLASLSAPEVSNVAPYAGPLSGGTLVGIGGKDFTGASSQARAAFVYGGGADIDLTHHVFLRAECRGFVYNSPTYDFAGFAGLDRTTHRAEPSVGFGYRW